MSSNMVNVKFYRTHTGHSLSVGSLHLTTADRAMVAELIAQGVPDTTILKKVRESIQVGLFRRVHLLSKQDIRNIRKEYKLDDSSAHQDDATSVDLWVRQQERLGKDSPVIYYKAQGTEDNGNKLSESDFMIVLMTEYQQKMAKKFCAEKVLIDSTHGTNKYKFYLTTLLTVDEFGAGCPVSYCLSTHTDTRSMQVFFEQIKKCIGNIKTKVFMSDDCDCYYSAWSVVMGHSEHRLLCTWHVDRTWRRNICAKVNGNAMLKSTVYKALKTLHLQTDREKFSELLDGFLTWCAEEEGTEEFGKYFKDRYSWRAHMWAYSYRIGLGLNTNMFLEANHKTLKYSYLLKKINNRVDKCIQALLHRTRDSLFQRLIRLCKGTERTTRSAEISKSHRRGCGINKELIHCVEDGTWHVYTVSDRPPYTVTYTENSCTACPLSCTECKICVHSCVCSCTDNLIKGNLCEHIHAVEISKGTVKLPMQDRFCRESSVHELTQIVAQQTSGAGSTVDYRAALEDRLTIVQQLARSANSETAGSLLVSFDKLIKEMRAGIASQKELVGPHFPVTSAPPNETCRIQRQFQSVRKTCEKKEHSFATPSCAEIETIIQDLLGSGNSS
ncbi:uncharacterized protein LOC126236412 [Schistocerca nitens]|uniref:uncharacterized protein LOC126236412 n=1 Tax=Schistocerca nitens TaxID=7011 RepID=UPI002117D1AB|nr:uncharacterized protein LOC126236412 [Schistocerca nitens]